MELVCRSSTGCQEEIFLWSFSERGDLKMVTCFLFLFSSLSFFPIMFLHFSFYVHSQNCKKRLLALSCVSVCMEQVDFHCTDFHEIRCLSS